MSGHPRIEEVMPDGMMMLEFLHGEQPLGPVVSATMVSFLLVAASLLHNPNPAVAKRSAEIFDRAQAYVRLHYATARAENGLDT